MTNTNTTTTTPLSSSSSTSSSPVLVSVVPAYDEDDPDPASSPPPPPFAPVNNNDDDDDDDDTAEKKKQPVNMNESNNPTVTTTTTASRLSPSSIMEWYRTWFFTFNDWRRNNNNKNPPHHHHTLTTTTTTTMMMNVVGRQCHDALTFYVQFMTSSLSHPDKILKFLQYTFYMVSQALMWHQQQQQRQQQQLARPNIATAQWLDKLYQEFTWARYILRILQFPVALDAALQQSWTLIAVPDHGNDDPSTLLSPRHRRQSIYNALGRILTYSMVVYYPTELMAYLFWMKPKAPPIETTTMSEVTTTLVPSSSSSSLTTATTTLHHHHHPHGSIVSLLYHVVTTWRDTPPSSSSSSCRRSFPPPETWSYLSCRCWLIYIVTELIQSYVQYQELTTTTTTTPPLPTLVDPSKQRQHILLQSLRNLLFLLPCTAWSMSKWDSQPILSSRTVNTLLWFESIVSLYQAVQQQQRPPPPVTATTQPERPQIDDEQLHHETSRETNI